MNPKGTIRAVLWDSRQSGIVLSALAERPFKDVFELIGVVNGQAHRLFRDGAEGPGEFRLAESDLELCLDALQDLPYRRVRDVIARIEEAGEAEQGGDRA